MGWIKYKYDCRFQDNVCVCDSPNIDIEISNGQNKAIFRGLIDSGCQTTMLNSKIADMLHINLDSCENINVGGATGEKPGKISETTLKLKDFDTSFKSPAIFVDDLPVPILLGQDNFFEKFKIKFERMNGTFELMWVE